MQAVREMLPAINGRKARESASNGLPQHVRDWLRAMNSQLPGNADWSRYDTLAYGQLVADLSSHQLDTLLVRLMQECDFRPSAAMVKRIRQELFPRPEAEPGHVRESRRSVQEVLPERDRPLLPAGDARAARERFRQLLAEADSRREPFNLARAIDGALRCGLEERERIRKEVLRQLDREADPSLSISERNELAWEIFCREYSAPNNAEKGAL